jgi:hypothetical protein
LDCKNSNTYYKISKETLLNLLAARLELNQLEYSGVDNWSWYGEGYQEFMKEEASDYISEEEIPEDIDAEYVAKLMLRDYEEI